MKLDKIFTPVDRIGRASLNKNFSLIEGSFNNVVQLVADNAYDEVVNAAKLIWQSPVDTFSDLATTYPDAEEGWVAMVRDTGFVYRYNSDGDWEVIQEIAVGPVNEVDERLTERIDQTDSDLSETLNFLNYLAVEVESFGAAGDGTTDDLQAINDAIVYVGNRGGGKVLFKNEYYSSDDILVQYDNVELVGQYTIKSKIILAQNKTVIFHKKLDEVIPYTEPQFTEWNNMPPFKTLKYFDASEYGGPDYRLENVGISNLTIHKLGTSPQSLFMFKCDNSFINDVNVTFENPAAAPITTSANAILVYYSNNFKIYNVDIADNFRLTFGLFVYWSINMTMNSVRVGNVGSKGIELKHVVNFVGDNLQAVVNYNTTPGQNVIGLSVGYGSHLVKLTNIYLKNCTMALINSVEYKYSTDIVVDNLTIDDAYIGVMLWHLKNFKLSNVQINMTNRFSDVYAFLHTIQPLHKFSDVVSNDGNYTPNTARYKYDHDYDFKQLLDYLGVNHYRYYEYLPYPTLNGGIIDNLNIELTEKASTTQCNVRLFGVQVNEFNYNDLVNTSTGRYKLVDGKLPLRWQGVDIKDVRYTVQADNNPATRVRSSFLPAAYLSLEDCNISSVKYEVFNASAANNNDNVPDVADVTFLNLAKLKNVELSNINMLPYAAYGNTQSTIRAFENLRIKNMNSKITNLSGSYNPTFLKLFEVLLGENSSSTVLTNEDYKNPLFDNNDLKGYRCMIGFNKAKLNITNTQLTNPRFINNSVTNSAYNESNFTFMMDVVGTVVDQPPLKQLNTVNNVLVPGS